MKNLSDSLWFVFEDCVIRFVIDVILAFFDFSVTINFSSLVIKGSEFIKKSFVSRTSLFRTDYIEPCHFLLSIFQPILSFIFYKNLLYFVLFPLVPFSSLFQLSKYCNMIQNIRFNYSPIYCPMWYWICIFCNWSWFVTDCN